MPELILDAATASKLRAVTDRTVLKDEAGRVIGVYEPEVEPEDYQHPDAQDGGLTPEEWEQRINTSGKTYTTAEVLDYMRSLK